MENFEIGDLVLVSSVAGCGGCIGCATRDPINCLSGPQIFGAGVLGGAQSLHTNGYDEAISLPTEEAAKIALRTQQIIAYESGVADTVDPLGGSFFIENLTDEMEAAAFAYIQQIEEMGGAVKAIASGFMQDEISSAAYDFQVGVEQGVHTIVGVNRFVDEVVKPANVFRVDDSIRQTQIAKLSDLRNNRSADQVSKALSDLREAAAGTRNTMPFILSAVEAKASLGEISDVLREVFGEF